jgi:hypothetical protein
MTEPHSTFTPEPPDPQLEELDEKIATLMAEALTHFILRNGLLKREQKPVDSKPTQSVC